MLSALSGKKILVAPLEWGLGHATRCMPLIDALLAEGAVVLIGGDGASFQLLKEAYPHLKAFDLPAYNIEYPSGNAGAWKTLFKAPQIIRNIRLESVKVAEIALNEKLDAIISDNRYGAYSKDVYSVFMCHQVRVLPPKPFRWGAGAILRWHRSFIENFNALWIPDVAEFPGLAGELSHNIKMNIPVKYIGPLSRFEGFAQNAPEQKFQVVAVLSGPEPQRSILEAHLLSQMKKLPFKSILVRGVVTKNPAEDDGNVRVIPYLQKEALHVLLQSAEVVVCRSGYSTIMDLSVLGKKVILIPTPGQTEQQYLAERLEKNRQAVVMQQQKIDLGKALSLIDDIMPLSKNVNNSCINKLLPSLLNNI